MGFRTVVMLSNDQAHDWSEDPKLGEKILQAMHHLGDDKADFGYGAVVECTHADTQTLAVLDGYTMFRTTAHSNWSRTETNEDVDLKLLKRMAEKFGYTLRRKPVTKA